MDVSLFKRVLLSFAESPADIDIRAGSAIVQVRDEVFDIRLKYASDDTQNLLVIEHDQEFAAQTWLLRRIAKMPQLADRIISVCGTREMLDGPFVHPLAMWSPDLAYAADGRTNMVADALQSLTDYANRRSVGATSVMYLTSDAGEGKTTLINRGAYEQAKAYKDRKVNSLIVPIPLSGRAFLTFDDAVIAALVNKLRFNYFYFDAFLWLVRLGAIIPAFDGYEEMLVEGSKGEAVSALGGLVQTLDSSGSVIIAARKAFFDYLSFKSQARLLDAIGSHSASFSRLELSRWKRAQALEFGSASGIVEPAEIYDAIAARLGEDHPLLTRAVLVTRLFEVAKSGAESNALAELLAADPQNFFFRFVDALVNREAKFKWLARVSGELMEPLLTPGEHHELLAQIAVEMWQSSSRYIKFDTLDVVIDLFAEERKKSGYIIRQVKERIKQHSLLATEASRPLAIGFDHEDFQDFYLGEGLGRLLASGSKSDLYAAIAVNVLSPAAVVQGVQYVARTGVDLDNCLERLKEINAGETGFSFCKENCAVLALRISEFREPNDENILQAMYFPAESLSSRMLKRATFEGCHFQPTSVAKSTFDGVVFRNCEIERLDLTLPGSLTGCEYENCRVDSIYLTADEEYLFDPARINECLVEFGAHIIDDKISPHAARIEDDRVKLLIRFFRIFLRTTQINEEIIRLKLGPLAARFFDDVLPALQAQNVLIEVVWDGRGIQRRYRLGVPMTVINRGFELGDGSFEGFLKVVGEA